MPIPLDEALSVLDAPQSSAGIPLHEAMSVLGSPQLELDTPEYKPTFTLHDTDTPEPTGQLAVREGKRSAAMARDMFVNGPERLTRNSPLDRLGQAWKDLAEKLTPEADTETGPARNQLEHAADVATDLATGAPLMAAGPVAGMAAFSGMTGGNPYEGAAMGAGFKYLSMLPKTGAEKVLANALGAAGIYKLTNDPVQAALPVVGHVVESAVGLWKTKPELAEKIVAAERPSRTLFEKAELPKLNGEQRVNVKEVLAETRDIAEMGKAVQEGAADQVVANETAPPARAEAPQTPIQDPANGQEIQTQAQGQGQELPLQVNSGETPPPVDAKAPAGEEPAGPPELTSAREAWIDQDRKLLNLDELPPSERRGWDEDLARARSENIPERALGIAAAVVEKPRALETHESAGLTVKLAEIKNAHDEAVSRAAGAAERGDTVEAQSHNAEADRLQQDGDLITRAMGRGGSGSERGRQLAAQKFTINRDYSLFSVQNRLAAKAERPLKSFEKQRAARKVDKQKQAADRAGKLRQQIDDLRRQVESGQPARPVQRQIKVKTKEIQRLEYERDLARGDIERMIQEAAPKGGPLRRVAGFLAGLVRAVQTTGEMSYVLRQGGPFAFGHPIKAAHRAGQGLWSTFSGSYAHKLNRSTFGVGDEPWANAELYQRSGGRLADPEAPTSAAEEVRLPSAISKIPIAGRIITAVNRGGTTFLNSIRRDAFDAMLGSMPRNGEAIAEEARVLAAASNNMTGTTNLGSAERAAGLLNNVFYSARYLASRFNYMAGRSMWGGTMATRKAIATEYARTLIGYSVFYGLAKAAGATIETDPRSSDFMKLRFGATRIDPLGGLSQITTFNARFWGGKTKQASGRIVALRGPNKPYGGQSTTDVLARFFRTKLAPLPSSVINVNEGRNVVGQQTDVGAEMTSLQPITYGDIYKAMLDQGVEKGTAMGILSFFGMGLQTYQSH